MPCFAQLEGGVVGKLSVIGYGLARLWIDERCTKILNVRHCQVTGCLVLKAFGDERSRVSLHMCCQLVNRLLGNEAGAEVRGGLERQWHLHRCDFTICQGRALATIAVGGCC